MKNPFDLGYYKTEELKNFGFLSIGNDVQIAKTCNIVGLENISIENNTIIITIEVCYFSWHFEFYP